MKIQENGKYTLTEDEDKFIIVFKDSKTKTEHYVEKEPTVVVGDDEDDEPTIPEEPEEIIGTVNFGNTVWNEGKASVTVSTTTKYQIEYQKNTTNGTWIKIESGKSITGLQNGDIVYARLTNGTNAGKNSQKEIKDITAPTITSVTATINSVTVVATDRESGINGYAITTNNNRPNTTDFRTASVTNNLNQKITGLTENTTYYVWVKDVAGNISNSKTIKTSIDTPPDLTTANVTFTSNPSGWTNGNVVVTANTSIAGYTLQTSKNASSWSNTNTQTFSANGTMYARLISTSGTAGDHTSYNVTNIDKEEPKIIDVTATTKSITMRATDYESGINGYTITTSYSTPSISSFSGISTTKVFNRTLSGLTPNVTYYLWVKDQAGNISTGYAMRTADDTPPALTSSNVTFSQTPSGWTNQDVTVTVSTTETGYTLQTSQDLVYWTSTNKQIVETNGPVYARLVNSSGTPGDHATYNVTNIDKVAPGFSKNHVSIWRRTDIPQGSVTFNKIVDEQSGISKVILYYKTESEDTYSTQTYMYNYPGSTTEHTFSFGAMFSSQYEDYYMYAEIYDAAGNIRRTCTASLDYEGNTNYADDTATY